MITIALAQHDFLVGDIQGNLCKSKDQIATARTKGADLILFPELSLTGYPPEDLLLRPGFLRNAHGALADLIESVYGIDVVIGHPWEENGRRYNAVSWIRDRHLVGRYFKHLLPNYAVFDEQRYFTPGSGPLVIDLKGTRIGVIICEDAWEPLSSRWAKEQGAELLLVANASPYRDDKLEARREMFAARHKDIGLPMAYCNLVGGQDELVFDGRSMLMDGQGFCTGPGPLCEEALLLAEFDPVTARLEACDWPQAPENPLEEIYRVLVCGLRDYVRKNGFTDVVFGLSGGIDSALTLALAADALGAEQVHTVMMPSRHTSGLSLELAQEQAVGLGADHRCISIEPAFEKLMDLLNPSFQGCAPDITEENLQARLRGDIVMALSVSWRWGTAQSTATCAVDLAPCWTVSRPVFMNSPDTVTASRKTYRQR
jgi:predicted amidohydrolase